ncbi:MAG: RNA-binding protein, partial [Clostridia bacterium]|nr:RNA-binding protein [Clostridia bacterium]
MKLYPIVTGSVVRSLAGRDQGRLFVVIQEIDDDFVYVANGKLRTMDRLKKKRRKHLKPTGTIVED